MELFDRELVLRTRISSSTYIEDNNGFRSLCKILRHCKEWLLGSDYGSFSRDMISTNRIRSMSLSIKSDVRPWLRSFKLRRLYFCSKVFKEYRRVVENRIQVIEDFMQIVIVLRSGCRGYVSSWNTKSFYLDTPFESSVLTHVLALHLNNRKTELAWTTDFFKNDFGGDCEMSRVFLFSYISVASGSKPDLKYRCRCPLG